MQIAISAGHEFIVTTDAKHAEICDDKIMYLDYVSVPSFGSKDSHGADVLALFFFSSRGSGPVGFRGMTIGEPPQGYRTW